MPQNQECRQCGTCCEKWGWDQKGSIRDLVPWIADNRKDILQHVGIRFFNRIKKTGQDIGPEDLPQIARIDYWVSPEGKKLRSCPFFFRAGDGNVYCRIHGAKPEVCTSFTPWNEGIRDYALHCPACRDTAP